MYVVTGTYVRGSNNIVNLRKQKRKIRGKKATAWN